MKKRLACGLYSVHKSIDKGAAAAVRAAAEVGFEALEFYGAAMQSAAFVRSILQDTGLQIAGWHVGVDFLKGDKLAETLDFHSEIGNRAVVVPWLPPEMRDTADAWLRTAEFFSELLPSFEARGISLGYHNHDFEFQPLDGSGATGWDIFAKNTPRGVVLQLDIGNAMAGGADPVALLRDHPGRSRTLHLKPYSHSDGYDTMVGRDDIPWRAFLAEAERQGATDWHIAEYESDAMGSDLDALRIMREALREFEL